MKKKSSSWPFLAHPAAGHETTFYLRVALLYHHHGHMLLGKPMVCEFKSIWFVNSNRYGS